MSAPAFSLRGDVFTQGGGPAALPVVREGQLKKRAIGKKTLSRSNWKTRWFRLTSESLKYYADQYADEAKGCIDIGQMLRVEASMDGVVHGIEITHYSVDLKTGAMLPKEFTLVCQAESSAERDQWIAAIKSVTEAEGRVSPPRNESVAATGVRNGVESVAATGVGLASQLALDSDSDDDGEDGFGDDAENEDI